jgi:hypothetical protein
MDLQLRRTIIGVAGKTDWKKGDSCRITYIAEGDVYHNSTRVLGRATIQWIHTANDRFKGYWKGEFYVHEQHRIYYLIAARIEPA